MRQPFLGGAVLVGLLSLLLCGGAQAQMDTCLDGSRTLIPGGPGNEGCHTYDGNQAQCEASYIVGGSGPTSCYFDSGDCNGCGPNNEGLACANVCQPAKICAGDRGRIYVGGSGTGACHVFDSDPASCNNAFTKSNNPNVGLTSCFFAESGDCEGCGPDNLAEGACENQCAKSSAPAASHSMLFVLAGLLSISGIFVRRRRTKSSV